MRILTVVFNLEKGGTQRAAQNFAEAYRDMGHDSRVLATHRGGVREDELRQRNVSVWHGVESSTVAEIAAWRPEVVHVHSHGLEKGHLDALFHACPDARLVETNVFSLPSPWVRSLHVSFQLSMWCDWLYHLRGNFSWPSAIVPNPVRSAGFRRATPEAIAAFRECHGVRGDEIVLGRVGQAYDRKWSPLLIEAFENVRRRSPRTKLIVVNPPRSIVERCHRSQFSESIVVIDHLVGDEAMSIAYSAMDIFVHVADQGESFGLVLTEAMLCETPVVTLSTPWEDNSQAEVVGNDVGGLVATTRKGFGEAIDVLVRDDDLRARLGTQGRQKVLAEYESHRVAAMALNHAFMAPPPIPDPATARQGVLHIYRNAIDSPSWLTCACLGHFQRLQLTRYTTGYQPWASLFTRCATTLWSRAASMLASGRRDKS